MKPIRFSSHALEQCAERGADEAEVLEAIRIGTRDQGRHGRLICRANFQYNNFWNGHFYAVKQVAPVVLDKDDEIIVVTVYTFFF